MTQPTSFTSYKIDRNFEFRDAGGSFQEVGTAVIFKRGHQDPLILDARPTALPDLAGKAKAFEANRPGDAAMIHKALRELKADAVPA